MKLKKIIPLVIASCLIGLSSCTEEVEVPTFGCYDTDSPMANLDADFNDSTCVYMYVTEFEISYFDNKTWDPNNPLFSDADIVLKLGDATMDSIYYDSYRISNADATQANRWVAHDQFKLKNQVYTWELYNEAVVPLLETEDLMATGQLNPLDFKNDSVIVMTNDDQNTQIKIRYAIR